MPIVQSDIKLLASQVMSDVPEGGGAPTSTIIPDGASNAMFPDISEASRAAGRIQIRQVSAAIQSADTDTYMDGNVIVATPPNDPNVSITLMKAPGVFARRTAVANAIESYLVRGPMLGAYLLENHVINMRRIELLQRAGAPLPPVGRTLVLVLNEGLPNEVVQFVRTTRVEAETRTFTDFSGGNAIDFVADVVKCDISDKLRYNFAGSPASRGFAGQASKTIVRDTTVADAGSYAGVVSLRLPLALGDSTLFVKSVYTQLVPNARTETIALDQKPAAQRSLTLATTPRNVTVGVAPHTLRIKVGQENRGFAWTQMLRPLPAAGTVVISYRALGNWYTVTDDGAGVLIGSGAGTINYLTGSLALTLPSLPDVNSSIITAWGEKTAFTNRSGQAGFRAPEYAFKLNHDTVKPGTVLVKWLSAGVLRTATDNGTGGFVGGVGAPATGEINYATGNVFIRPTAMPDAGAEFNIDYQRANTVTKVVTPIVDSGGFASIVLDTVPVAGSVSVRWVTVRSVSNSSGGASSGTSAMKSTTSTTTVVNVPAPPGEPVRSPGLTTRVFGGLSGSQAQNELKMVAAGTRATNGQVMFVAIVPNLDARGWGYDVPDALSTTVWSEVDIERTYITVGGATGVIYHQWGVYALRGSSGYLI